MIPYNPYEFYREGVIVKKLFVICFLVLIFFFVTSCSPEVDIKTYTISFNANGADSGTAPNNILVSSGEKYTIPSCGTLSKNGYTFSHWNTISDGSGSSYTKSSVCKAEEDLTLYAQWKIVSYTIEYDLAGGKLPEGKSNPDSYTIETETFTLNNPEREGYEFVGWRLNNGEPNSNVSIQKGTFENKKFVAIWRQFASFSVIYDPNGGEGNVDTTYKDEGQTVKIASGISLVRNGYTFSHWNTKPDGTGANYNAGNVYSDNKDLTLYAQWKIVSYTIEYDLAGGTLPEAKSNPDSYTIETETFTLNNPEREGYEFVGWRLNNGEPNSNVSIQKGSSENKTFIATWIKALSYDYISSTDSYAVSCINKEVISLAIPKTYNDKLVTVISDFAFSDCTSLNSVTIPDSVTSIGDKAFCDCTSLNSVTIPDSVTSIGDKAFCDCTSLNSVTIPDSVISIGGFAFYGCSSLTNVTIPSSVTSIDEYAFSHCKGLTSVTIQEGVTSIGNSVFSDCTSLNSVTIPNSVTSIGYFVFRYCTSLNSITIPDSVTSIGGYVFGDCTSLNSVTIPSSVTSISEYAFGSCERLKSITIPDSVTSIGEYAFYNCERLNSVTIPDSVTSIGEYAFYNCERLNSVTIPDSVTSIGKYAFSRCKSLGEIYYRGSFNSFSKIYNIKRTGIGSTVKICCTDGNYHLDSN